MAENRCPECGFLTTQSRCPICMREVVRTAEPRRATVNSAPRRTGSRSNSANRFVKAFFLVFFLSFILIFAMTFFTIRNAATRFDRVESFVEEQWTVTIDLDR